MATILVVDDDQAVRAAITIVLQSGGFEVVAAENGSAGRKALEAQRFDAAVVDIFMPEMDGLETIKMFRLHCPDMPIIAVSGAMGLFEFSDSPEPPPDYLAMATKLGAVTAVQKPFQPRQLLQAVQQSIGIAA
jgi:CheY-like chemotaxis protein